MRVWIFSVVLLSRDSSVTVVPQTSIGRQSGKEFTRFYSYSEPILPFLTGIFQYLSLQMPAFDDKQSIFPL